MNDIPAVVSIVGGLYLGGVYGIAESVIKEDGVDKGLPRIFSRVVIGLALGILGAINQPTITLASLIAVVITVGNMSTTDRDDASTFTKKVIAGAVQGATVALAVFLFVPPALTAYLP